MSRNYEQPELELKVSQTTFLTAPLDLLIIIINNTFRNIAFFAFLATVSATTVKIGRKPGCNGLKESYDECGINNYFRSDRYAPVESAIITDNGHGVAFYGSVGCTGVITKSSFQPLVCL